MMNSLISKLLTAFGEIKILMVGLNAVGKEAILNKLKVGEIITTFFTLGFSIETCRYKTISLTAFDVDDLNNTRPFWSQHIQDTKGIIFVVDSCDREHIKEAGDDLMTLITEDELMDADLLVFANNCNSSCAMNTEEIWDELGLQSLHSRRWYVQEVCITTGDGLQQGVDWFAAQL